MDTEPVVPGTLTVEDADGHLNGHLLPEEMGDLRARRVPQVCIHSLFWDSRVIDGRPFHISWTWLL